MKMTNVLEYLEASAAAFPDKTAFADEHAQISFRELLLSAQNVGAQLIADDLQRRPAAILMEKSVDTIQLMLGVVFAGGFYVMLDAAQPPQRLNRILETLQPALLITNKDNLAAAEQLEMSCGVRMAEELLAERRADDARKTAAREEDNAEEPAAARKEDDAEELAAARKAEDAGEPAEQRADAAGKLAQVRRLAKDTDPLYVVFTSGSTGVPKGVVVCHRSVIDFIDPFTEIFGITSGDVLGNQAPFDFDVSVKDIYSGLRTGATVQMIPRRMFSFPALLLDFLDERGVTNLTWAVSALAIVSTLNGLEYRRPSAIRRIMFSGEIMPVRHLNYWRKHYPEAEFVNLYGPTEITCNCSYYRIDREFEAGEMIPVGEPFPNETVFLLDEENRLVTEAGKSGEICVSGTALALGYYRNPEQTNAAFVQNPLNSCYPELIYRTGDLGAYNSRGELCFASRKDFQIKHMGHRIELGEIEAAMEKVPEIRRSCCVYLEEKSRIVCFYQGDISVKDLSSALQSFLPEYMIPNVFNQKDELPITKNGKIDRTALKAEAARRRRRKSADAGGDAGENVSH